MPAIIQSTAQNLQTKNIINFYETINNCSLAIRLVRAEIIFTFLSNPGNLLRNKRELKFSVPCTCRGTMIEEYLLYVWHWQYCTVIFYIFRKV